MTTLGRSAFRRSGGLLLVTFYSLAVGYATARAGIAAGIVVGLFSWLLGSVSVLSGAAQRVRRSSMNMLSISVMAVITVVTMLVAASILQSVVGR